MLCFCFSCCFFTKCGCCWRIGWSFATKVRDKWNNLSQAMYFNLFFLVESLQKMRIDRKNVHDVN
jgi:hypothetical protein